MIARWRTAVLLLACAVPAPVLVAACVDERRSLADADRAFVAQMLPHHHLGMLLNDLAAQHSSDVRLRRLVFEMTGYHASEVELLGKWADEQDVEAASEFQGRIPDDELAALRASMGPDFDLRWLDLMIRHHRGALEIASAQTESGTAGELRMLAGSVAKVQGAEIVAMQELVASLCAEPGTSAASPPCGSVGTDQD